MNRGTGTAVLETNTKQAENAGYSAMRAERMKEETNIIICSVHARTSTTLLLRHVLQYHLLINVAQQENSPYNPINSMM